MESHRHQGDLANGLAWAAGVMVGLLAAVMALGIADHAVGRLRRLRRELGKGIPPGQWSDAILGSSMHAVLAAWGPPPITTAPRLGETDAQLPSYLAANTWYYPINPSSRMGMAIYFVRGIVRRVQVIATPR